MSAGVVVNRRMSGGWLVAVSAASVVLISGCTASIDPDELSGVYRNDKTGSELRLESDGTFSAAGVSTDGHSGPADFHGGWEFLDDQAGSDFIYLTVEGDGLGGTDGIQLYPSGRNAVEFRPDPDGPPGPKLTKAAAP